MKGGNEWKRRSDGGGLYKGYKKYTKRIRTLERERRVLRRGEDGVKKDHWGGV